MIKKAVITGLIIALMIQKLKHIAALKNPKLPRMLVSEVDEMLYKYNMSPTDRIHFKTVLVRKKIMEENYTDIEVPFPLAVQRARRTAWNYEK